MKLGKTHQKDVCRIEIKTDKPKIFQSYFNVKIDSLCMIKMKFYCNQEKVKRIIIYSNLL